MEYIGIDIGTSSLCVIAYNPSDKSSKTIVKENNANLVSNCQWERIQAPERISSAAPTPVYRSRARPSRQNPPALP